MGTVCLLYTVCLLNSVDISSVGAHSEWCLKFGAWNVRRCQAETLAVSNVQLSACSRTNLRLVKHVGTCFLEKSLNCLRWSVGACDGVVHPSDDTSSPGIFYGSILEDRLEELQDASSRLLYTVFDIFDIFVFCNPFHAIGLWLCSFVCISFRPVSNKQSTIYNLLSKCTINSGPSML